MSAVVLDTHVIHWWATEPSKLSRPARRAIDAADEVVAAAISWYELAWLARHDRVRVATSIGTWLASLDERVRTIPVTAAIALAAVDLPASFPPDPADRLIYATALELGARLVTKDERLREHKGPRPVTVW